MASQTPLQTLKKNHGSKAALVGKLVSKLENFDSEDDDAFKERLLKVSNKKLLRLFTATERVAADFGDKGKLVDELIGHARPKQGKDGDYRAKLMSLRITRLLDMHDSAKAASA